jgi:glycosyltransferase involved in cell wall biosynthesis
VKIAMHMNGASIRGSEKQSFLVASGLRDRGHEVVVSCRRGGQVEALLRDAGIATTAIRPRGDADLYHALAFAAMLRAERPGAFLDTSWKRAFTAGWAARVARVPRVFLRVGGVHAVPPGRKGWKYRHALPRYYEGVIVNSRTVAEHLLSSIPGLRRERVHLVPNSVRLAPAPPAPLRAELGIPGGVPIIASVGALEPRKGHEILIRALAALDADARVVVVGEGPERERLRGVAASNGVADRVHLIGHRTDVAPVLAAADMFVLSSRGEGMAVVMLEATVSGLPVVATDFGGVWELLEARGGRPPGGWVVPVDDVEALAHAIAEVLSTLRADPAAVAARVAEARWRLDHWFTVDAMVDAYEALLTSRDE